MRISQVLALLLSSSIIFSCHTTKEVIPTYLQGVTDTSGQGVVKYPDPLIQKGDQLSIQIYSSAVDPAVDVPYNLPNMGGTAGNDARVTGFLVDQNGNIEYPRIGTIQVEGLTKQQLADIIKARFQGQLSSPSVIIRFMNFRVTIVGEVASPNTFTIPSERVNIMEALGLAGGITDNGVKSRVKILREANGNREIGTIDLTSKTMFESPFYTLRQNDIVIVDQSGKKSRTEEEARIRTRLQIALSILNAAVLLYNIFGK